ncbi:NUDIX hydrolase [Pedococcus bigeumensis]|uniref:NUDIX hydrolase n=1 Tax=Pedococcus bigeumensis TaxID=433644 RepID=UPI0031E460FD
MRRHSVSVAAAIFDDSGENVLLIRRRDTGHWEPPGGVLEVEETIEDGLRREVLEETGAGIEVGPLTGAYKNMTLGVVALVFRCRLVSPFLPESIEAAEVAWCEMSDLPELMVAAFSVRLTDAESSLGAATRAHDGTNLLCTERRHGHT